MFNRDKGKPERQQANGSYVNANASDEPVAQTPVTNSKIETVIGPNCRMNGILQSDGGVRIDGIFDGTIQIQGNLVVGEAATIIAEVQAYNIIVSGTIKGNVTANRIEITETGKVWGDLNVNSLLLNEGAFLRGNTNMNGDMEPPVIEAPKVVTPRLVAPPVEEDI